MSALGMTAVDRYLLIVHQKALDRSQALKSIAWIFIISVLLSLPPLINPSIAVVQSSGIVCIYTFWDNKNWLIICMFVISLFVIALVALVLVFCYLRIWMKYKEIVSQVQKNKSAQKKEKSLIISSIITCTMFVIFWTPFYCKILYEFSTGTQINYKFDYVAVTGVLTSLPMTSTLVMFLDFRFFNLLREFLGYEVSKSADNDSKSSRKSSVTPSSIASPLEKHILLILGVCGFPLSFMPLVVIMGKKITSNMLYPIYLSITNILGCVTLAFYNAVDANARKWALGLSGCQGYQALAYFICIANLMTFAMIAVDRYYGVLHSRVFSSRQVLVILAFITVFGFLFAVVPPIVVPDSIGLQSSQVYCVIAYWAKNNLMVQFMFWYTLVVVSVALFILVFCYYRIWRKFKEVVNQVSGGIKSQKKEKSIIISSVVTCLAFVVLYTPYLTKVFDINTQILYEYLTGTQIEPHYDFICTFLVACSFPTSAALTLRLDYRFYGHFCEMFGISTHKTTDGKRSSIISGGQASIAGSSVVGHSATGASRQETNRK
ncbi:hypothetical protein HDV06_002998 [Boothiomyces sp. JEL0866]|nr:hypothetical protein HDV06_000394 [Boothiomyces sp. JEL0866]KAJ3322454.1 hypothetical protein HDV06_002998 [Boothiomyces sp. JEL0866]